RPFVAPARLVKPPGVGAEDDPDRRAERRRAFDDLVGYLAGVKAKVIEQRLPLADDRACQRPATGLLAQVAEAVTALVAGKHEPGLGRNRDLRVRVQHQLKQRCPRAGTSENENWPVGAHGSIYPGWPTAPGASSRVHSAGRIQPGA